MTEFSIYLESNLPQLKPSRDAHYLIFELNAMKCIKRKQIVKLFV